MIVETFVTGPLETNTYLVADEKTGEALVIDPAGDAGPILARLAELGMKLKAIVSTHGHFDHISGNRALAEATGAPILAHESDLDLFSKAEEAADFFFVKAENSPPPDRFLQEGDELTVGACRLKVVHTPGHSPGGITLTGDGKAFCGDLVFYGSVGRTDLPGGSQEILRESIRTKIVTLPDDTVLYPGHGPETTVRQEKSHNPFF
jgi:glyoxylase-like metal-dependent hydrolase (beta-lactamase superfamily II)